MSAMAPGDVRANPHPSPGPSPSPSPNSNPDPDPNPNPTPTPTPNPNPTPSQVLATYADVSHAQQRLGYTPRTSIDVGLRKFIRWYRSDQFRPEFAEEGEWRK